MAAGVHRADHIVIARRGAQAGVGVARARHAGGDDRVGTAAGGRAFHVVGCRISDSVPGDVDLAGGNGSGDEPGWRLRHGNGKQIAIKLHLGHVAKSVVGRKIADIAKRRGIGDVHRREHAGGGLRSHRGERDRIAEVRLVRALEDAAHHARFKTGARTIVDFGDDLARSRAKIQPGPATVSVGALGASKNVVRLLSNTLAMVLPELFHEPGVPMMVAGEFGKDQRRFGAVGSFAAADHGADHVVVSGAGRQVDAGVSVVGRGNAGGDGRVGAAADGRALDVVTRRAGLSTPCDVDLSSGYRRGIRRQRRNRPARRADVIKCRRAQRRVVMAGDRQAARAWWPSLWSGSCSDLRPGHVVSPENGSR